MRHTLFVATVILTRSLELIQASHNLSDMLRVPITTIDGPAFVLVGRNDELNTGSTARNPQTPEGLIIVKEAPGGIEVQFVAPEAIPQTMKSLIIEKMKSITPEAEAEVPKNTVAQSVVALVEPSGVPFEPPTEYSSTTVSMDAAFVTGDMMVEDNPNTYSSMGMDDRTDAVDDFVDLQTNGYPKTESATMTKGSLSSGNITSTLPPRSGKVESRDRESGKLSGERDPTSSARDSYAVYPAILTLLACLSVSISVGFF